MKAISVSKPNNYLSLRRRLQEDQHNTTPQKCTIIDLNSDGHTRNEKLESIKCQDFDTINNQRMIDFLISSIPNSAAVETLEECIKHTGFADTDRTINRVLEHIYDNCDYCMLMKFLATANRITIINWDNYILRLCSILDECPESYKSTISILLTAISRNKSCMEDLYLNDFLEYLGNYMDYLPSIKILLLFVEENNPYYLKSSAFINALHLLDDGAYSTKVAIMELLVEYIRINPSHHIPIIISAIPLFTVKMIQLTDAPDVLSMIKEYYESIGELNSLTAQIAENIDQ